MSTSSTWSARRTTSSGTVSRCVDARDPLDDVVERLQVLDVDRGDDVDAGVEQLLDVLPALLVARCRGRWCGRARRRAPPRAGGPGPRRGPSPRRSCRGTSSCLRGTTSSPSSCSAVCARPWVSTKPIDDVGAALAPPLALVEHGVRLADPGRRPEVDAQPSAAHSRSSSPRLAAEREVQLEHVDPRLAEEAERPALDVVVDELRDVGGAQPASLRDPGDLQVGVRRADVRVEAGAAGGDRVRRDGRRGDAVLARRSAARRFSTAFTRSGGSGRGWSARGRACRSRPPPPRAAAGTTGARRTPGRSGTSRRPCPAARPMDPSAWPWKATWPTPVTTQRVDEAEHHGQGEQEAQAGESWRSRS